MLLLLLLLLLSVVATSQVDYTVVNRIDKDDSVVAVVHRKEILYLLYDETIIGAVFDYPHIPKTTVYPGFIIMQCAAYLEEKPTRAVQIGLGTGAVPSFLRKMNIPTDVVEISDAVVKLAAKHFEYEWCPGPNDEVNGQKFDKNKEKQCPNGQTFVMDGLKFLSSKPDDMGVKTDKKQKQPYDLFIVDVYTGSNPVLFFVREKMLQIRANWLTHDGVLIMNFVGFMQEPRAVVPKSIYQTLKSVFKYVKCYREMEETDDPTAANIVFYASEKPFSFNLPTTEPYRNPPRNSYHSVVKNFPTWEIFTELHDHVEVAIEQQLEKDNVFFLGSTVKTRGTALRVLTEADHGQDFQEIHTYLQEHMRQRVLDQFPLALWNELKYKTNEV